MFCGRLVIVQKLKTKIMVTQDADQLLPPQDADQLLPPQEHVVCACAPDISLHFTCMVNVHRLAWPPFLVHVVKAFSQSTILDLNFRVCG